MRYFVSAADDERAGELTERLRNAGYDVVEEYEPGAVVLSVGGDGAILYNARRYGEPTLLPVRVADSEGNRIQVDVEDAVDRVSLLESGREGEDYRTVRHHKLTALVDGDPVRDGFRAMNDVHLHHASPVRAAKFGVTVIDGGEVVYETDGAIGDGLLVATPFGSTAYYRSITGSTFAEGLGVAFNNAHKPADAPESLVVSPGARVRLTLNETTYGENALLVRDDDPDPYRLSADDPVEIRRSEAAVEAIRFPDRGDE
ncbi:hypothetical protein BRD00_01880 [Halobacteriales archaeon QS_8_69_26]|nr:MAG: hypothetical protein BRD00_01880 [Halobacteriales archaeon QS_8_69_26]